MPIRQLWTRSTKLLLVGGNRRDPEACLSDRGVCATRSSDAPMSCQAAEGTFWSAGGSWTASRPRCRSRLPPPAGGTRRRRATATTSHLNSSPRPQPPTDRSTQNVPKNSLRCLAARQRNAFTSHASRQMCQLETPGGPSRRGFLVGRWLRGMWAWPWGAAGGLAVVDPATIGSRNRGIPAELYLMPNASDNEYS